MGKIILNENEQKILDTLNSNGRGYVVGGAIRDMLLGLSPNDVDFCTDIDYPKLKEIFKNNYPKEIGKHFGVLEVLFNNVPYEIAKLRKDKEFQNRKDLDVIFTDDILEDLERRDFTINAIAYDGTKLITLNQLSINDLSNKLIRFVGDAENRIIEDGLRILRAFRFSSQKNFKIEKDSLDAICSNKEYIKTISKERICNELLKIIESDYKNGMVYLYQTKILNTIFNIYTLDCRTEKFVNMIYDTNNINARIFLFYHMVEMSTEFEKIFNLNKIKHMINIFNKLIKYCENINDNEISSYHCKKIKYIAKDLYYDFIELCKIYKPYYNFANIDGEPVFLKDLDIDGNDIIANNKKDIGKYLNFLLDVVHKNSSYNKKELLLSILKRYKNEHNN